MRFFFFSMSGSRHSAAVALVVSKGKDSRNFEWQFATAKKAIHKDAFWRHVWSRRGAPVRRSLGVECFSATEWRRRKRVEEGAVAGVRCAFFWVGEQEGLCAFQKENIVASFVGGRSPAHEGTWSSLLKGRARYDDELGHTLYLLLSWFGLRVCLPVRHTIAFDIALTIPAEQDEVASCADDRNFLLDIENTYRSVSTLSSFLDLEKSCTTHLVNTSEGHSQIQGLTET